MVHPPDVRPASQPLTAKQQSAPVRSTTLTDAGDDVEQIVDLLVHRRGDDLDLGEGVGHRVDPHLRHEQGHQQDLILLDVVVLKEQTNTNTNPVGGSSVVNHVWTSEAARHRTDTHQQHSDGHHGGGARGDGAVHQDHVVLADLLGQPQVVELAKVKGASEARQDVAFVRHVLRIFCIGQLSYRLKGGRAAQQKFT